MTDLPPTAYRLPSAARNSDKFALKISASLPRRLPASVRLRQKRQVWPEPHGAPVMTLHRGGKLLEDLFGPLLSQSFVEAFLEVRCADIESGPVRARHEE